MEATKSAVRVESFVDGTAINGDCLSQEVIDLVREIVGENVALVVTDPPYGNIIDEKWDMWNNGQKTFVDWMMSWTKSYADLLILGGSMYVWGCYGIPGFRPFFEYASRVESETIMRIANFITWSKKRAYGVQHNYLATQEDILYMIKGDIKKPAVFNVPLLDTKRGYAGYNEKYPAKSEFYRRTNVWTDITEIFSGKVHVTQKPIRVFEIPIEVNTKPDDWIIDPFAGSMTAAIAARKLGRKWICIESDSKMFDNAIADLNTITGSTRKR